VRPDLRCRGGGDEVGGEVGEVAAVVGAHRGRGALQRTPLRGAEARARDEDLG